MPVYVDNLLLTSNLKDAIQHVKEDLASHFMIHDQGPIKSILSMKVVHDRAACTISISQPGYIRSIIDNFNMSDCNLVSTPMEQNIRLSRTMCSTSPEEKEEMRKIPYHELISKLLYLAVATCPDILRCWRTLPFC